MSTSTKRKFSDFHGEAFTEGGRKHAKKQGDPKSYEPFPLNNKPKHKNGGTRKNKERPENLSWIKKRTRTIERRFRTGETLPAEVRHDMETELAHHRQKIAEAADDKKRSSMIKKYHMVRFFERKKAERLAKQIETRIKATNDPDQLRIFQNDLDIARTDALYAKFFPHRERYISMYSTIATDAPEFKSKSKTRDKPETASTAAKARQAQRPPLWSTVEKLAKQGVPALVEFRERKVPAETPKSDSTEGSAAVGASVVKARKPEGAGEKTQRSGKGQAKDERRRSDKSRRETSTSNSEPDDGSGGSSDVDFFE